jgi:hypothetical protein
MSKDPAELFLDYLEKENTILGVISTFCILAAAFVIKEVLSASSGQIEQVAKDAITYIYIGSALMFYAGHRYFRQRSLIAWYQGQISLAIVHDDKRLLNDTINEVDTRFAWRYYNTASVITWFAFIEYSFALITTGSQFQFLKEHQLFISTGLTLIPIIAIALKSYEAKVLEEKYPNADSPLVEWLKHFIRPKKALRRSTKNEQQK